MSERSFRHREPSTATPRQGSRGAPLNALQAAVLSLQASAGNRAVSAALSSGAMQRYVVKRVDRQPPHGWKFYSSLDQKKGFAEEEDAIAHDALQEAKRADIEFKPKTRYPTLYTYTYKRTTLFSQIGTARQGPHTIDHKSVVLRLQEEDAEGLADVFEEQVPHPDEITDIVLGTEKPSSEAVQLKLERYLYDYESLYSFIDEALDEALEAKKPPPLGRLKQLLATIMGMHPYATSAWKTGLGAKHSKLAIKPVKWIATPVGPDTEGAQSSSKQRKVVTAKRTVPVEEFYPEKSESSSSKQTKGKGKEKEKGKGKQKETSTEDVMELESEPEVTHSSSTQKTGTRKRNGKGKSDYEELVKKAREEMKNPPGDPVMIDVDDDTKKGSKKRKPTAMELVDPPGGSAFVDKEAYKAFEKRRSEWIDKHPTKKPKKPDKK